ncbi:MAG: alanine racemase [Candidatus Binatia bacterium]|nr:MAG: alanine racemase [Candidatus Binatia bacterium]
MRIEDLATPALVADLTLLLENLRAMAEHLPGKRLRPHVKAHKCTALAKLQRQHGHRGFCCATVREAEGLALAGLGEDVLLANEIVDSERLARLRHWPVIIAVDSEETIHAAARAGVQRVLIDVNVGLPRCGCAPEQAGRLAQHARQAGLVVEGVMGYEGHAVGLPDRLLRQELCEQAMQRLLAAHHEVGGSIVSAGGTGTFDLNRWATEIQAGSYVFMDTHYAKLGLPFRQALFVWSTVVSASTGWAVADCGLKALGMDHGNPAIEGAEVLFCSDEHVTFVPSARVRVGEKIRVWPAHVDPTVAYHERLYLVENGQIVEQWPIDLRGW